MDTREKIIHFPHLSNPRNKATYYFIKVDTNKDQKRSFLHYVVYLNSLDSILRLNGKIKVKVSQCKIERIFFYFDSYTFH